MDVGHGKCSADNAIRSDKSTNSAKRILLTLLFFLSITIGVGIMLTNILRQKWDYATDNAAQQIVQGYYKEPEHSLDVLCLGASTIRNGVSSLEMYHNYGFTTYSRATSIQLPIVSYYLLLETLQSHDIKAVVMDASNLANTAYDNAESISGKLHEAIDYMPWSKYKINLIKEVCSIFDFISPIDFVLPLYTYHDRWSQIEKDDFIYHNLEDAYYYKGQFPTLRTTSYTFAKDYMADNDTIDESFFLVEDSLDYCRRMIQVCKEKDIAFVLVKAPAGSWNRYRHDTVQSFADDNGVAFLDFNDLSLQKTIEFNPQEDFFDAGRHPNITGAQKISQYLGEYLVSLCTFEDKRENPNYASWDQDFEKYNALLIDAKLSRDNNITSFIRKLNNPNYITIIATRNDTSKYFSQDVVDAFKYLSIYAPFKNVTCMPYFCIIDGNEKKVEQFDANNQTTKEPLTYSSVCDGHAISIISNANQLTGNNASILFDGEEVSPNSSGFNFVVYDKSVSQIIARRAFNTGAGGREYKFNPFLDYGRDPITYFDLLNNEDYITIMAAAKDGSRYVPGIVNDKLSEMGLLPIDGQFDQPYIGILNGSKIIYNEYGAPNTELSTKHEIEGVPVTVISDAASGNAKIYLSVGEAKSETNQNPGLILYVYSKSEQRTISYIRFNWSNNYYSSSKVNGIDNIQQLLTECRKNGYDVFCLYNAKEHEIPAADCVAALNDYGFARLVNGTSYAGVVRADGSVDDLAGYNDVELSPKMAGLEVSLTVGETDCEAEFNGVVYSTKGNGLHIFVYDGETRSVLAEILYASKSDKAPNPFAGLSKDPLAYFDLLNNEDYITIMAAAKDGSRYVPGIVNDKLSEMGLLPIDGQFDQPYIGILNGSKIVYNEYGAPDTELSTKHEIEGVPVTVISDAASGNAKIYLSVGEAKSETNQNPGLILYVYSKSEQRTISYIRFNWSNNYYSSSKVNGIDNIQQLLTESRKNGYDVFCLYNVKENLIPVADYVAALNDYGFTQLKNDASYVGVVRADGSVDDLEGYNDVELSPKMDGLEVSLKVGETDCEAVFNDVIYSTKGNGLHLFVYDGETRAVLTEILYASKKAPNPFTGCYDPVRFLELIDNDDFITAIVASKDGSRNIPGIVNDKLSEMGLIPLDGELDRPYIGILDGSKIVYNEYGDPNTELSTTCEIDGVPVKATSRTSPDNVNVYISVGNGKAITIAFKDPSNNKYSGLIMYVYSKSKQKLVGYNRFQWTND